MTGQKLFIALIAAGILMLATQSCTKQPVACFTTTPGADSIHRNQPVVFDGRCSVFAGGYNWQFYGNQDSIAFTPTVTKVFKDTGSVQIYLLVTYGNNYAGTTQYIQVQP